MRLIPLQFADILDLPGVLLHLSSLSFINFEVPFINKPIVFCFGLSRRFVSFLLCVVILCFQLFHKFLLPDQLLLRVQELLRQIRNLHFVLQLFVFKLVTNELTLLPSWENIVVIEAYYHLVDSFCMWLQFINLFIQTQRITTVSDWPWLVFLVSAVQQDFLAIQKCDFGDVAVSEYPAWGWYSVLDQVLFHWLPFLVFLGPGGYFDLVNALVLTAYRGVECPSHINCPLIDQT